MEPIAKRLDWQNRCIFNCPSINLTSTMIPRDALSSDHQYQPGFVGGPGSISGGGSGLSSLGFRIIVPKGRLHTRRVSNGLVSAWAHHHWTKNRFGSRV